MWETCILTTNAELYCDSIIERNLKNSTLNKWRHVPCSRIGKLNIDKMSILPELTYGFNDILIQIPEISFVESDKLIL